MTQEEKELLIKDLCARLPYGVVVNIPHINGSVNKKLVSITCEKDNTCCINVYSKEKEVNDYTKAIYNLVDILPYLRPMSSMTEEEKDELCKLCDFEKPYDDRDYFSHYGVEVISEYCVDGKKIPESCINYSVIDFFYEHHIDWRGLIPMGLALEAPEDMYK